MGSAAEPAESWSRSIPRQGRLVVGLTGGLASGKSTVAAMLARKGAVVIDADELARVVVEPGQPALQEIVARFGAQYLDEEGRLRRKALGRLVFEDPQARRDLEAMVQPRIREEMWRRLAQAPPHSVVVLDVPLLFETGRLLKWVDVTVLVYADRETQLARLMARDGCSLEEAETRLASQWPLARKLGLAHWVVYNQADRAALARQVDDLWERLQEARARPGQQGDRIACDG